MSEWIRPTTIGVDTDAIKQNAEAIFQHTGRRLYAVVKADGYGHGAVHVARALQDSPAVCGLAVSLVEEGIELRENGIHQRILILGPSQHGGYDEIITHTLTPVISHLRDAAELAEAAKQRSQSVAVHLKIDTGMGRLGLATADAALLFGIAKGGGPLRVEGLMTHLASADSDDPLDTQSQTAHQLSVFSSFAAMHAQNNIERHVANSAGAMSFPDARWDAVRVGLALYGNGPWRSALPRKQAMRLVTRIAQVREVEPGATVGYGALWTASRHTRAAVVPVGYADGYARAGTGRAVALVDQKRCPVIGAISMDMLLVDISDTTATAESEVILLGSDASGNHISVADLAGWFGVSEYEVTCGMSKRVPRVYGTWP